MNVSFHPVSMPAEQASLADLAARIWQEYWPARIGQAQTDYMVERFQGLPAIQRDMSENGYEYWFVRVEDESGPTRTAGYTGGHVEAETDRFFISKIYLLAEERGHGFARRIVEFYEQVCRERGLKAMYLTVNKGNDLAIRAYRGCGFETVDATETDIGQGFVMDDYIMERRV